MRRIIDSVLVLVSLGFFTVAVAQLPPEIIADAYLLQMEQAIRDGDADRAQAVMQDLFLLQEENEVDLPDEFHFRYAQVADAVNLPEQALESIVTYLAATGRDGPHYVEALELMNKAQDEIEERQEAGTGQPASTQEAIDFGDDSSTLSSQDEVAEVSCEEWNTGEYFETATVEAVTACLAAGADPEARDERGYTPLHRAAQYNENPAVIEILLAAGADPEAGNDFGYTPLHRAAQYNENPAVIEILLAAGADPEAGNDFGYTPLHWAAWFHENPAVIEILLAAGADPEAGNDFGDTPLDMAARYNRNPSVREVLLAAEADLEAVSDYYTPLHLTAQNNADPAVIEDLLATGADPNARTIFGQTPLHRAAAANENPAVVQTLLTAGADPNARTDDSSTPLHYAARYNENPAVIETLLAAGADLEEDDDSEYRPLHYAARYNENPAVTQVLITAGADIEEGAGDLEYPPLHLVARYDRNPAMIEVLLEGGADLDARMRKLDYTPLHIAARYNDNPAMIEFLLKAGADLEAETNPGVFAGNMDVVARSTPLHEATSFGSLAVVEVLLAAGADWRKEDDDDRTPLHRAARYNENPAVIETLLAAGADLEARDDESRTPLYSAAQYNENPAVIEALLAAGADLEARNEDGDTLLQIAADDNGNPAVREVLLAAGAGQTASERARREREAQSGPGLFGLAVGIIGGAAIAVAGDGSDEAIAAGGDFAEGVLSGQQPAGNSGGGGSPALSVPAGNTGITSGGGSCQIPGYPTPTNPQTLGLAWCPASVDFQWRVFALQAAGAQCAIATGSSSTPEQINARYQEINAACGRLDALGVSNCQCPASVRP